MGLYSKPKVAINCELAEMFRVYFVTESLCFSLHLPLHLHLFLHLLPPLYLLLHLLLHLLLLRAQVEDDDAMVNETRLAIRVLYSSRMRTRIKS